MITYDTLYHRDENENVRIWRMEQDGGKYRTVSGIVDGKLVVSEWKAANGKNVGKSNATTDEEQAASEVNSHYTKKLERKYYTSIDEIEGKSKITEPMLADKYKGWDKKWTYGVFSQPKLDGMRCIAKKSGLFSRQGKPILAVPHIHEALKPIFDKHPSMEFDGELYNHALRDDFNELLSLARQSKPTQEDFDRARNMIEYHVYDVIAGEDTLPNAAGLFLTRNLLIKSLLLDFSDFIKLVRTTHIATEAGLDEEYSTLLLNGYEGQMVRLNLPYEHKRSKSLLKRKEFIDEEFEIIEIEEGKGNWAGYAKSATGITADGVVFAAGIKGNQEFTKELLNRDPRPQTMTVRYQNKTPDGSLRFPIAVAFWDTTRDV